MRVLLFRSVVSVSVLLWFWSSPVLGQWLVGLEVGADRFWGGSIETTADRRSFRPYRPTVFGLGLEHPAAKLGYGLRLRYMDAALGLEGDGAAVALAGVFEVFSVSPELLYRVATAGGGKNVLLHAGPLLELWRIIDEESQTHIGVQGSVSFSIPLGSKFAASVVAEAAVSPSPFSREQLEENFEPRTLWRRGVAARLQYRL
jgi:hypothetical protein